MVRDSTQRVLQCIRRTRCQFKIESIGVMTGVMLGGDTRRLYPLCLLIAYWLVQIVAFEGLRILFCALGSANLQIASQSLIDNLPMILLRKSIY